MKFRRSLFSLAFGIFAFGASHAQQVTPPVSQVLEEMRSTHWQDRSKAFDNASELLSVARIDQVDADRLKVAVIQLLTTENSGGLKELDTVAPENYGEGYGEDKSNYYSGLIEFVSGLNDERSISALLGAAGTGAIATRGVAQFGDKALDATLAQLDSQNPDLACGALSVIRQMLRMKAVRSPESRLRIKAALREALGSPDYRVRTAAISSIEYLDGRDEFIPILQHIAAHDPYKSPYNLGAKINNGNYQVRHIAELMPRKVAAQDKSTTIR
jgi:hypothetical protein